MPKINNETLFSYFTGAKYHAAYNMTKEMYVNMRVHAEGEFPEKLIKERRPNESEEILLYREKNYKPITKLPLAKVFSSLSKIRRSPDWTIEFPQSPAKIIKTETLEEYLTKNLPGFGNITDWTFSVLLKQIGLDPNAVIAVLPSTNPAQNEYHKPVPVIFNSDQVLEFNEQYAILKGRQGDRSTDGIFYYIDEKEIITFKGDGAKFEQTGRVTVPFFKMPVLKVPAEYYTKIGNTVINKSRLDSMLPFLDEAAAEYSDLKGSKVQHLYPKFWYFQTKDCAHCSGLGKVSSDDGPVKPCGKCDNGKVKFSPFASIAVNPAGLGQTQTPTPPAGYISSDTKILELQEESVDKNNFKALASINMQFLDQTPLNISGEAKNVDREELNNFVYNYAEDIVKTLDNVIYFISEWRYYTIIPSVSDREALLPKIPVPQNFDLLPSEYLIKEISDARAAKVNPFILAQLESELSSKKFYNNPALNDVVKLYHLLDPLPGYSIDDKMSLSADGAITKVDYVISTYLAQFMQRAIAEDSKFLTKKYVDQVAIFKAFAEEKIKENSEAIKVVEKLNIEEAEEVEDDK